LDFFIELYHKGNRLRPSKLKQSLQLCYPKLHPLAHQAHQADEKPVTENPWCPGKDGFVSCLLVEDDGKFAMPRFSNAV
jgi:hypothetical protein